MTEVVRSTNVDPSGWEVGMHVVSLPGGASLVFSPTWHGEGTFERVLASGEPAVLVAPNHYHHLSMKRFRARFPAARAVSSATAAPRLTRQGHEGLGAVTDVASLLGSGARLSEAPFTKNGELLLSLETEHGRTWVVCDAFFHVTRPTTGAMGLALRMLSTVPGLRVGRTYRWLAVADRARYLDWMTGLLSEERPKAIHFAHGEPLVADDLPDQLLEAARAGLG
jgi:hypothetical protein